MVCGTRSKRRRRRTWKGTKDTPPTLKNKQALPLPEINPSKFWHLYSTVGPQGVWTITSTREAHFSLRDEKGLVARTFVAEHLPRELDQGFMLSPVFMSGSHANALVGFTPQSRALFLFNVRIGSAAQRQRARDAENKVKEIMELVNKYAGDRNAYRSYEKPEVIQKMRADLADVPKLALDEFVRRAERAPKDLRAKRKVSSRSFAGQVAGIREALIKGLKDTADEAASLEITTRIDTPDMIHDAVVDKSLHESTLASGITRYAVMICKAAKSCGKRMLWVAASLP